MPKRKTLAQHMRTWGPVGVSLFSLAVAGVALFIGLIALPEASVDTTPTRDDKTVVVTAATGIQGFKVKEFCEDDLTKVLRTQAPDAGYTIQLTRMRDQRFETVTVIEVTPDSHTAGGRPAGALGILVSGTHSFDTNVDLNGDGILDPMTEPADLSGAEDCIRRKAK